MFFLCFKIFVCRIIDMSLATIRTVMSVRGKKLVASLLGFIEALIWFLIVREALNVETSAIWIAIAYAGGFASGTYIGGAIVKILFKTNVSVQVVTISDCTEIIAKIKEEGYGCTILESDKSKTVLFVETKSDRVAMLKKIIHSMDQNAFIVCNESTLVEKGYDVKRISK